MPRTKVKSPALPDPAALLRWYDKHGRDLPWRVKGGLQEPYRVWLSEIMLQQTTVVAVAPYYAKFLSLWPTVEALAAADLGAIRAAWAGLGYYRRAANLHRCAQIIVTEQGGQFPADLKALKALPGIGDYTSAAIGAIAFDLPANVVDGNVERIMARLFRVEQPLVSAKKEIRALAAQLLPKRRHGDYAQALMDLGATVCTVKQPKCGLCPWQKNCGALHAGKTAHYPVAAAAKTKPVRHGTVFWFENRQGAVWLRQRPEKGLLGGMIEVPSGPWRDMQAADTSPAIADAPLAADWRRLPLQIRHNFTHFDLYLEIMYAKGSRKPQDGFWIQEGQLAELALPNVMRKVCAAVLAWRKR